MRPYILSETNWKLVKNSNYKAAVLPWGATEAHNYHLPYGTDNYQIEAIAAEAAGRAWERGAKTIILPNIPYGVNTGQTDIHLDMNIYPSTQLAILSDLIEVLDRQGIHKLIVLNGHGGNNFKTALRELGVKYPQMLLVSVDFFNVVNKQEYFEAPGDHADEMETSLMLHLNPELVSPLSEAGEGKEKKSRIKGIREGWAWSERAWSKVTEDTGIGNPKKATAGKGEKFFNAVSEKIAGLLLDVANVEIDQQYED